MDMKLNRILFASLAIAALVSCQRTSTPYMELEENLLTLEADGGPMASLLSN